MLHHDPIDQQRADVAPGVFHSDHDRLIRDLEIQSDRGGLRTVARAQLSRLRSLERVLAAKDSDQEERSQPEGAPGAPEAQGGKIDEEEKQERDGQGLDIGALSQRDKE